MRHRETTEVRSEAIEQFINDYLDRYGAAPSMQAIADDLGIGTTTVFYHIKQMEKAGRIVNYGPRGYIPTNYANGPSSVVPVVGNIACGTPILAQENIEEYVRLPESLFGRGEFFLLRAKGSSMINAGIDNGDLVLIRQQPTAEPGEIVSALVYDDDWATLKRFYPEPEKGRIRLHPENDDYDDMYYQKVTIQGVAVHVIKKLK